MGMYTQIALGLELKSDTPLTVIDRLRLMIDGIEKAPGLYHVSADQDAVTSASPLKYGREGGDSPLWECDRWTLMLRCGSYYFDWQSGYKLEFDDISKSYYLTGSSNLKNYDGEIDKFLDWLAPFIATSGFIGFKRYEEEELPTLLYVNKDNKVLRIVPPAPNHVPDIYGNAATEQLSYVITSPDDAESPSFQAGHKAGYKVGWDDRDREAQREQDYPEEYN